MSPDDKQKHEGLRARLKAAKNVEDAVAVAEEAIAHLLDHVERLDARLEAIEKNTVNISSKGGKTFLG